MLEEKCRSFTFRTGQGDWLCREAHKYGRQGGATVVRKNTPVAAEAQGLTR